MYAIESLRKAASYAAAPPTQAQTAAKSDTTTQNGTPTVAVSSASRSFSGLGDLILSSSSTGSEKAATADGDEGPNGREVNDGDADDAPLASPSVSFSDAGTYSVSV